MRAPSELLWRGVKRREDLRLLGGGRNEVYEATGGMAYRFPAVGGGAREKESTAWIVPRHKISLGISHDYYYYYYLL